MSDNLKELEQRCDAATVNMRRIVSGIGSTHTFDEGEAAIRAMGEAGKAWQIAKMTVEVDATVAGMIEQMRASSGKRRARSLEQSAAQKLKVCRPQDIVCADHFEKVAPMETNHALCGKADIQHLALPV
jgi:hypothetical protein